MRKSAGGRKRAEQSAKSGPGKKGQTAAAAAEQAAEMSQYVFAFELLRQYPNVRAYIIKQPLQKSFKDQLGELLGGKKR